MKWNGMNLCKMHLYYSNKSLSEVTMSRDADEIERIMHENSTHISMYLAITLSAVAVFVTTRKIVSKLRRDMAQLTVIIVGAGPVGLSSALIAVHCKRVKKLVLYEEQSKFNLENRSYQIAIQSSNVSFLRGYGLDFDNLEGLWHDGCFYTRVGIYLEYIIHVLPLFSTEVELKFRTRFDRDTGDTIDNMGGRKLVICCDGGTGTASRILGLSDECILHPSGIYGAVAAIERNNHTLVPTPEKRVHNLSFDLSAYVPSAYEEDGRSQFSLKIFGNSKCRHLALAVNKCESNVVRALKTVLDKSMMRNIFLKCFNTYKRSDETSISDSYCLNNMKFSPRLYEIKLSQRMETVAYVTDCDLFTIAEGEASRSCNFNTGSIRAEEETHLNAYQLRSTKQFRDPQICLPLLLSYRPLKIVSFINSVYIIADFSSLLRPVQGLDINLALNGLSSLQPFIEKITLADTEYHIMKSLVYKMEHSERMCRDFLRYSLKDYIFV